MSSSAWHQNETVLLVTTRSKPAGDTSARVASGMWAREWRREPVMETAYSVVRRAEVIPQHGGRRCVAGMRFGCSPPIRRSSNQRSHRYRRTFCWLLRLRHRRYRQRRDAALRPCGVLNSTATFRPDGRHEPRGVGPQNERRTAPHRQAAAWFLRRGSEPYVGRLDPTSVMIAAGVRTRPTQSRRSSGAPEPSELLPEEPHGFSEFRRSDRNRIHLYDLAVERGHTLAHRHDLVRRDARNAVLVLVGIARRKRAFHR